MTAAELASRRMVGGLFLLATALLNVLTPRMALGAEFVLRLAGYRYGGIRL